MEEVRLGEKASSPRKMTFRQAGASAKHRKPVRGIHFGNVEPGTSYYSVYFLILTNSAMSSLVRVTHFSSNLSYRGMCQYGTQLGMSL
jgi:hypothetical protein